MKSFSDLGIKPTAQGFTGDKIKIDRLLNREIIILDFKISPSTQKAGTECLTLQIEINEQKHVVFTGAKGLMETIKQVPREEFPFKTTIIKEFDSPRFT